MGEILEMRGLFILITKARKFKSTKNND